MKYKLPVVITLLEDEQYMANCEALHAIATGDTPDEAIAKQLGVSLVEFMFWYNN